MKVKEFIQTVIAPNTIIRLWKPTDPERPYTGYICLNEKALMSWEILKLPKLCEYEALFVTDIFSESTTEAVNIIIQTDMSPNDVEKLIHEYEIEAMNLKANSRESEN